MTASATLPVIGRVIMAAGSTITTGTAIAGAATMIAITTAIATGTKLLN